MRKVEQQTKRITERAIKVTNGALYRRQGLEQRKKLQELQQFWSKKFRLNLSLAAALRRCIDLVYDAEIGRGELIAKGEENE